MRFEFLYLGKTREPYLAAGIADYGKRLSRYISTDFTILKEKKGKRGDSDTVLVENESEVLIQGAGGSYLVCMDRSGRQMDSLELAAQVERWEMQGLKKVTFVIGGPLGLSPAILAKADFVLSLSTMTFTHEMTRLLLLEQLYRVYTIKAGEKYHK